MTAQNDVDPNVDPSAPSDGNASQDGDGTPDYSQLLEEQRANQEALEERVRTAEAENAARQEAMVKMVREAFTSQRAEPEPEPEPDIPNISDEAVENMTPAQLLRVSTALAERIANKKIEANNKQVGQYVRTLYDRNFSTELDAIQAKDPKAWEIVGGEVEKYFEENSNERYVPGAVERKYYELKGRHSDALAKAVPSRTSAVPTPSPASPAPDPVSNEPNAPKLTAEEARVASIYGMSPEEYSKWQSMDVELEGRRV